MDANENHESNYVVVAPTSKHPHAKGVPKREIVGARAEDMQGQNSPVSRNFSGRLHLKNMHT